MIKKLTMSVIMKIRIQMTVCECIYRPINAGKEAVAINLTKAGGESVGRYVCMCESPLMLFGPKFIKVMARVEETNRLHLFR